MEEEEEEEPPPPLLPDNVESLPSSQQLALASASGPIPTLCCERVFLGDILLDFFRIW